MSRLHAIRALTAIPSVGDRLATRFYEELGIRSARELVDAAVKNRLQGLRGIGPQREAQILEAARAASPERADHFLAELLRCSACGFEGMELGSATATCPSCRRTFAVERGVIDLAPPEQRQKRTVTQHLTDSRFYARFYQDVMRPKLESAMTEGVVEDERALVCDYLELADADALLDVACGTGRYLREFARRTADRQPRPYLVGIDVSWSTLEAARDGLRRASLHEQVTLIRGRSKRFPLASSSFDRLHCSGGLHIMEDIDATLDEFARLLEPGGICVVSTFVSGDGILGRMIKRVAEIPTHFHWFSPGELHRRMARVGLSVVEETADGEFLTVKAVRR